MLEADASGQYRLTAAAVGFPTDWRLSDKMGQPLTAIHAPIHGYAEELAAGVDHFIRVAAAGTRSSAAPTGSWSPATRGATCPTMRRPRVSPKSPPPTRATTLFVRCERQTLRRLPGSGAVLFTIGIALAPLGALSARRDRTGSRATSPHCRGASRSAARRRFMTSGADRLCGRHRATDMGECRVSEAGQITRRAAIGPAPRSRRCSSCRSPNSCIRAAAGAPRCASIPPRVQLSTLLSIKTGGCVEDCGYCSQSVKADAGVPATKLMDVRSVLQSPPRRPGTADRAGSAWARPGAIPRTATCPPSPRWCAACGRWGWKPA